MLDDGQQQARRHGQSRQHKLPAVLVRDRLLALHRRLRRLQNTAIRWAASGGQFIGRVRVSLGLTQKEKANEEKSGKLLASFLLPSRSLKWY